MSNATPFRPALHPGAGRAKARRYRGPMGRVRTAALQARFGRHDPAPWDTGSRRRAVALLQDTSRRHRGPSPVTAHARLPRSARKPPAPVADGVRWHAAQITHRGLGRLGRRTR